MNTHMYTHVMHTHTKVHGAGGADERKLQRLGRPLFIRPRAVYIIYYIICMRVHVHVCVCVRACVRIRQCTYAHIHTYTYIQIYIKTL